jgi:hypothetical protein
MVIDCNRRNVLMSSMSGMVPQGLKQMVGIALVTADLTCPNRPVSRHKASRVESSRAERSRVECSRVERVFQTNILPGFRVPQCAAALVIGRVIASSALALFCVAPRIAFAEIPAEPRGSRSIEEPAQGLQSNGNSAQDAQAGGQQDGNLQPGAGTAEHIVSVPPQVTFEDGQLSIIADNARLSEIMTALRAVMGVDVDLPPSVARQRIWVRLGPGPARKILRDLLDNTELDYVIQASETDPDGIRSVALSVRSKTAEQRAPGSRLARGTNPRTIPPESSNPAEAPDQDSSTPAESAAVTNPDPAEPPLPPADGPSRAAKVASAPVASDSSLSRPGGTGSSEQMIQQLQSMYQQRRQMQIQQNQKPPSSNN